jgi:hypothetical protein
MADMHVVRCLLAGVAAALCGGTPAAAQKAEITQHVFDTEGLPRLIANPTPDGGKGKIVAWRICALGAPCQSIAVNDDRSLAPGDVAAQTVFEADALADDGTMTTARSKPWLGRVTASAPPTVAGTPAVGQLIRPVPASWAGGWQGDDDLLKLEACKDAAGEKCETVSAQGEDPPVCPGAAAVLGRRYEGWWLRAVDRRISAQSAFAGVGYSAARFIPIAKPSRVTVRSELVGPIQRGDGAFRECVRPRIQILRRVRQTPRAIVFATIACTTTCDVQLRLRDTRRTIKRHLEFTGSGEVTLPSRTGIAGRTVHIRVIVNGRHSAQRRVRLR